MENDILKIYGKGDIIYPDVFAKWLKVSLPDAYGKLDDLCGTTDCVRQMFLFKCPACGRVNTNQKYYSLESASQEEYLACVHCDHTAEVNLLQDFVVVYEKTKD